MILNPDSNQKGAFHENSVIFTSKATRIFKKEKAAETETFFCKGKAVSYLYPACSHYPAASKTVTKDQEKNKGSAPAKRPVSQTSFKPQFITPVLVREKK